MGTSILNTPYRMPTQDHPHAYGDKLYSIVVPLDENGSSPRVWGQALVKPLCCAGKRIIPTRMGTSRKYAKNHKQQKDHPHAYGDKEQTERYISFQAGSSPRVWGQALASPYVTVSNRIIPTRMGTRPHKWQQNRQPKDHPHAYGDKRPSRSQRRSEAAIIPTRMGTSVRNRYFVFLRRDHPHAYGDKSLISLLPNTNLGSSPRVWGQERKR